jgi:hypothetical protein
MSSTPPSSLARLAFRIENILVAKDYKAEYNPSDISIDVEVYPRVFVNLKPILIESSNRKFIKVSTDEHVIANVWITSQEQIMTRLRHMLKATANNARCKDQPAMAA